jgi:hypothetical protein
MLSFLWKFPASSFPYFLSAHFSSLYDLFLTLNLFLLLSESLISGNYNVFEQLPSFSPSEREAWIQTTKKKIKSTFLWSICPISDCDQFLNFNQLLISVIQINQVFMSFLVDCSLSSFASKAGGMLDNFYFNNSFGFVWKFKNRSFYLHS